MASFKQRLILMTVAAGVFTTIFTYHQFYRYIDNSPKPPSPLNSKFHRLSFGSRTNRYRAATSKATDLILLDADSKSGINCSKIFQLCQDEQLITYKHTFEIIQQDVLDFRRVILIVTLNTPVFGAIAKVHRLYSKHFFKVIYCVPSIHKLPERLSYLVNISIFEYTKKPSKPTGANFYVCLPIILDYLDRSGNDGEAIDGILTMSDDLIPNLWHFRQNRRQEDVLRNKLWLLNQEMDMFDVNSLKYCRGFSADNSVDCDIAGEKPWPIQIANQPRLKAFIQEAGEKFPLFLDRLAEASRGRKRVFNNYADLFYVSSEYFDPVYNIFRLMNNHSIYMEFAVGTAFRGIASDYHHIDFIDRSGQLGPEERNLVPSDMYDARRAIYHPFKLAKLEFMPFTEQCVYCSIVGMMDNYAKFYER